jgi:O-acetylserine/cysteine efflux transporter
MRNDRRMINQRYRTVAALIAAGTAWGTSVPLSKVALGWLGPGWLTAARFAVAAVVLLIMSGRAGTLRKALTLPVLLSGAVGYGGSVAIQNAGLTRTSVTHASLIIGATPILVAIIAAVWQHAVARPVAWAGFALSLAGVGLIAGGQGHGASPVGDVLVLAATVISASVTVAQGRLLLGRDPIALTAVLFLGAALAAVPFAAAEGLPAGHASLGALVATGALATCGTVVPFSLFAYAQKHVSSEVAGAFLNLEPLVGAVLGIVAFGDPAGARQFAGGLGIVLGIGLSSVPLIPGRRRVAGLRRVPGLRPGPGLRPAALPCVTERDTGPLTRVA